MHCEPGRVVSLLREEKMCLIELRDDLQGVREFLRFFSVDRICSTMVGKLKGRAPPCIQPVQSCFKILKEAGRRLLLFARRKNKGESTPFVTFFSTPSPFVPSSFSPFRIFFFFFFQGLVKSIAPKTDVNNGTPLPLDPCRDVDTRFTRLGR